MKAGTASFPAPIGGLNARDPLAQMKATDAVILENWYPKTTSVEIRKGYQPWLTGLAAPVETLFAYSPVAGGNKLFAAAGGSIYDASASGPVGGAVATGFTSAQWEYTNIDTPGGSFLWAVNGVDPGQLYNGATWAAASITGVSSNDLVSLCIFGSRLWAIQKNTLKVWYLAVQSISGAATVFDLATIFPRGGYLMSMGAWSIDAGSGLNDQAVFVSSEGEVAIYSGTDPASWSKIGLYYVGRPIGRRSLLKAAGDILLLTEQGVYPLSKALQSATIDRTVAITDKIQNAISEDVTLYGQNFGWQMKLFPNQNQLWLNVPKGATSHQYVMNTITQAWTKFTGMNANVFETVGQDLFFGAGGVFKAWTGELDAGSSIRADALPAYSNFKAPANGKYFTMVRPSIISNGNPSILFGLDLDFINSPANGALSYIPAPNSMIWGSMVWGSMIWSGGYRQFSQWQTVGGIGYYASIRLTVQSNGSNVQWNATDFVYQRGGVLS